MPVRDFTGRAPAPGLPRTRSERHARVALAWTAGDRPRDWFAAGRARERTLPAATAHGVRTSLLHRATKRPDPREAMRVPGARWRRPQVLIRFGHGAEARGPGPGGPRRVRPAGRCGTPFGPRFRDRRSPATGTDGPLAHRLPLRIVVVGRRDTAPAPAAPTDPGRTANREDGRHAPAVEQVETSTGSRCGRDRPRL